MDKELERIENRMAQINIELDMLNSTCAEELARISDEISSRILSYSKQEELDKTVEKYTKKIAKLIVELEELEEEKKMLEED